MKLSNYSLRQPVPPVCAVFRSTRSRAGLSGYPVVINNTLGAKVGLVIGAGAVIVDLDGRLETKWTDAVNDDIPKNQVRCRVETRAGVSVAQPGAVVCACRRRRDGFRAGGGPSPRSARGQGWVRCAARTGV